MEAFAVLVTVDSATAHRDIQDLLHELKHYLQVQDALNEELLNRIPPVSRKPANATALAAKVFAPTELPERNLSRLSFPDLLEAYVVNKTFYNTIEGSTLLQRLLALVPDPESGFSTASYPLITKSEGISMWDTMGQLQYCGDSWEQANSKDVKVLMEIETKASIDMARANSIAFKPPRLGSRCERTL